MTEWLSAGGMTANALHEWLKSRIKAARKRRAPWVHLLDLFRSAISRDGRAVLWTRFIHRASVHQTSPYTREDRYPRLFDAAARLAPGAGRILSFGCSTGEELLALRRRFPGADIVGAEINPRSRRVARARVRHDDRIAVVNSREVTGVFDLVFALAVLQREPHKIADIGVEDLTPFYSFKQFDAAVRELAEWLRPGALLVVAKAQYRIEDSSVADQLEAIPHSTSAHWLVFGRDGRRLTDTPASTIFRKL
jgi:SAM-dependent methyltransferase